MCCPKQGLQRRGGCAGQLTHSSFGHAHCRPPAVVAEGQVAALQQTAVSSPEVKCGLLYRQHKSMA